jgi:hypothetical protein
MADLLFLKTALKGCKSADAGLDKEIKTYKVNNEFLFYWYGL